MFEEHLYGVVPVLAISDGESGWIYYAVCALFFALSGFACGYFIWRKGNMQMQDAELEVKRNSTEIEALQADLREEEEGIRLEEEDSLITEVIP